MVRTTLVLGAGSAVDYGLPTGAELKRLIRESPRAVIANDHGHDELTQQYHLRQMLELGRELGRSGLGSIDAFLEARPQFVNRGKLAIAAQLLPLYAVAVHNERLTEGWYAWLFQALSPRPGVFDAPNLSIVTFNYDRSLETALYLMLRASRGRGHDEATEMVEQMRIVHVYGQLDSTEYERWEGDAFKVRASDRCIAVASGGIRVMSDERADDDPLLLQAREYVHNADRLVFLGFSYDAINLRRIGIGPDIRAWTGKRRDVFGTAYELLSKERARAHTNTACNLAFGEAKQGCLEFLRDAISL